jgi:hypothetical protein
MVVLGHFFAFGLGRITVQAHEDAPEP